MKTNYLKWNIYIANEASTGLFYSQTHNRNVILRKIDANKGFAKRMEDLRILEGQVRKTVEEVREINSLSGKWVGNIS